MKYVVVVGDGMADYPLEELGGKTPLQVANKPNMDFLALKGKMGIVKTVPDGMVPDSAVANLAILGYDPRKYFTGRGPLGRRSKLPSSCSANSRSRRRRADWVVEAMRLTSSGFIGSKPEA